MPLLGLQIAVFLLPLYMVTPLYTLIFGVSIGPIRTLVRLN
jgi:hypothetical protein